LFIPSTHTTVWYNQMTLFWIVDKSCFFYSLLF